MRYREIMKETEECLKNVGIADASVDAWYLLQYVLEKETGQRPDRTWYFLHQEDEMEKETSEEYMRLRELRMEHIPLQHLTHEQEFFGYSFYVNEHVLIPRQDTEILVEEALKRVRSGMQILDMCTGSGCILLSVLKEVPGTVGTGVDLSAEALKVARENKERLQSEAVFLQSDLFEEVQGSFDVIISNPPYIRTAVIEELMPEVKDHEPRMALDGTGDGLYYYRRIVQQSQHYLKKDGWLLFEIGHDQGEDVCRLLMEAGFSEVRVIKDLAGLDRVAEGKWNRESAAGGGDGR